MTGLNKNTKLRSTLYLSLNVTQDRKRLADICQIIHKWHSLLMIDSLPYQQRSNDDRRTIRIIHESEVTFMTDDDVPFTKHNMPARVDSIVQA